MDEGHSARSASPGEVGVPTSLSFSVPSRSSPRVRRVRIPFDGLRLIYNQPKETNPTMLRLGAQKWELHRGSECQDCKPLFGLQDRFLARQWLRQFQGDAIAIRDIRDLLSHEGASGTLSRMTDDELIAQMANLLTYGFWHVHPQPVVVTAGGSSGAGKQAEIPEPETKSARPSQPRAAPANPSPSKPKGLTDNDINSRLDAASWFTRDDEARDITKSLTREQLLGLAPATRQRLKDQLNSGWVSDEDKAALRKLWQAEHETAINQALKDQRALLVARKAELDKWDDAVKAEFKRWFGTDDEASRKEIAERIDKELALNKKLSVDDFAPADPPKDGVFAYVYPDDKNHTIYLDSGFDSAAATGADSKAGTLAHEMSHFSDIGGTQDHTYGRGNAESLAKMDPDKAIENADSFEYFVEKAP